MFDDVSSDSDIWAQLQAAATLRTSAEFVARVQLFGVPAAAVALSGDPIDVPWKSWHVAAAVPGAALEGALVVDLSSLWAGPLCGQILRRAGAHVVKVESFARPDGARGGDPRFYDWLHSGQESVAVDFRLAEDRAAETA
jgi:crotonobetainyl-CoA:carnitine CoA-transferase CaiB-like acyl-CoA transferase